MMYIPGINDAQVRHVDVASKAHRPPRFPAVSTLFFIRIARLTIDRATSQS